MHKYTTVNSICIEILLWIQFAFTGILKSPIISINVHLISYQHANVISESDSRWQICRNTESWFHIFLLPLSYVCMSHISLHFIIYRHYIAIQLNLHLMHVTCSKCATVNPMCISAIGGKFSAQLHYILLHYIHYTTLHTFYIPSEHQQYRYYAIA